MNLLRILAWVTMILAGILGILCVRGLIYSLKLQSLFASENLFRLVAIICSALVIWADVGLLTRREWARRLWVMTMLGWVVSSFILVSPWFFVGDFTIGTILEILGLGALFWVLPGWGLWVLTRPATKTLFR